MATALITGASRGLGLALAQGLAAEGWSLIIDARGAEALEHATAEILGADSISNRRQETGGHITALPGDVTDPAHVAALAAAAAATGGVDLVVNNASILGPSPQPELDAYPLDVLRQVYETNVIAPLAIIQALTSHLKPGARIINVTSDASVEPYEGWGGYGSSKAALDHLSRILAAERPALRVWAVDPGDMRTQMHQEAFPGEDISDRPEPATVVPRILALINGDQPSGRVRVA